MLIFKTLETNNAYLKLTLKMLIRSVFQGCSIGDAIDAIA